MKTKEQIELAQDIILGLQDYVELAKVEKKLKIEANKEHTSRMLDNIVDLAQANISEL